jgi:hypothetical protein
MSPNPTVENTVTVKYMAPILSMGAVKLGDRNVTNTGRAPSGKRGPSRSPSSSSHKATLLDAEPALAATDP